MNDLYKPELPPLPERMRLLPLDKRGYPVPWFVMWANDEPNFQTADGEKVVRAIKESRCWICGGILGANKVFVSGPMCGVSRVSGEPPSHFECAEYAVRACPFMVYPKLQRNEEKVLEGAYEVGNMIKRNPGVALLWYTRTYRVIPQRTGVLFAMGKPDKIAWFAHGRPATRREVEASVMEGFPELKSLAQTPEEEATLMGYLQFLMQYFPKSTDSESFLVH